jgi:hypothetical protein
MRGRIAGALALAVVAAGGCSAFSAEGRFEAALPRDLCETVGRAAIQQLVPGVEVVLGRERGPVDGARTAICLARAPSFQGGALELRLNRFDDGTGSARARAERRYDRLAAQLTGAPATAGQQRVAGPVDGLGDEATRRIDERAPDQVARLRLVSRRGSDVVGLDFTADSAGRATVERAAEQLVTRVFAAL